MGLVQRLVFLMTNQTSRPHSVFLARPLVTLLLFVALAPILCALPNNPDLKLDPTYGFFPRAAGHQYFPSGSTIKFNVQVVDTNGVARFDNNGQDYTRTVQAGTLAIAWSGGVNHWPLDGAIEPTSDLWINIESWPQNAGVGGEVVYTADNGATWQSKPLAFRIAQDNNDFWSCNLGTFPAGVTVKYAVKLTDTTGADHWHNNGGADFSAKVNGSLSSLTQIDAPQAKGRAPGVAPSVSVRLAEDNSLVMDTAGRNPGDSYIIKESEDLVSWTLTGTVPAGDPAPVWELVSPNAMNGLAKKFFRVEALGGETDQVFENNPVRISIAANENGAKAANIVFTADGGVTWNTVAMTKSGTLAGKDTWAVDLAGLPRGSFFQYAIELVDQQNSSRWMNNGGNDYIVPVIRPGQTDFTPPVASHSPSNTVTAAATLTLTLSATDNLDPAPKIYYTTDGTVPTTGSTLYSAPIVVTNTNPNGVDLTVRYFAIDAQDNRSVARTVDITVGQTQSFGPDKPYSTNPTLGQAVTNDGIVIDGANTGNEWNDSNLIAIDLVNDDPRSLGNNWTMHEGPADLTHMWARWDDTNLYLAWQFADITDVLDPSNAGSAQGYSVFNSQGILQFISFNTAPGGAASNMWSKFDTFTGADLPNVQVGMRSDLFFLYLSKAVDGAFVVDKDPGTNYFTRTQAGIQIAKGRLNAATALYGVGDIDQFLNNPSITLNNYIGHDKSRDTFYEMSIPLATLGVTRAQIESTGIGVFIYAGSSSAIDSIPNDPATLNTSGVTDSNSSREWGDGDQFTRPFARIGAW